MKQCIYCDTEVKDAAIRCPNCGKSLFQHAKTKPKSSPPPVKVEEKRSKSGRMIAAGAVIGFVILCVWLIGRSTTLACIRTEQREIVCSIQTGWAGAVNLGKKRPVPALERAWTEQSCGSDEEGRTRCVYYVQLKTAQGTEVLKPDMKSEPAHALANNINHFIENNEQTSLTVSTKNWPALAVWSAMAFVLVFALAVLVLATGIV